MFLLNVLLSFSIWESTRCSTILPPSALNIRPGDDLIGEKWSQSSKTLEPLIWPQKEIVIQVLKDVAVDSEFNITRECRKSLVLTLSGLMRRKLWAFQMMDSSSKFSTGFLNGKYADLGDFDQCLKIRVNHSSSQFSGKYCLYRISLPLSPYDRHAPDTLNLSGSSIEDTWLQNLADDHKLFYFETINNAICIPSTCSDHEAERILQKYMGQNGLKVTLWPHCDTKDDFEVPFAKSAFCTRMAGTILGCWTILVIVATLACNYFPQYSPNILILFSITETNKKIFREPSESDDKLKFAVATKLFFMTVGFYVHLTLVGFQAIVPAAHFNAVQKIRSDKSTFFHAFHSNLDVPLSGFFVLSGILSCYVWHGVQKRLTKNLSFSMFIIPRILRTLPMVIFSSFAIMCLPLLPGSGPMLRHVFETYSANCAKSFWIDMTFLSNFLPIDDFCHLMSWSLAVDFQLYVTSFFVIRLLFKRPKAGLYLTTAIIFGSMVIQSFAIYATDAEVMLDFLHIDIRKVRDNFFVLYLSPVSNLSAYYIGIFVGYFVVNDIILKNRSIISVVWIISGLYWVLYFAYFIKRFQDNPDISRFEAIAFGVLRKPLFAAYSGWLCYAIFIREAGILLWISSLKMLLPISRIFGSINMCHILLICYTFVSFRQPFDYHPFALLSQLISLFVLSIVFGYVFYILFEAPTVNLTNKLFAINALKGAIEIEKTAKGMERKKV